MDANVPLVIPEVNPEDIKKNILASLLTQIVLLFKQLYL